MEPMVLEGVFAAILELIGLDEVVQFQSADDVERGSHYDAAIVTAGFQHEIRAQVVITLPSIEGSGGAARPRQGQVVAGEVVDQVEIYDQSEVIHLLDQHAPTVVSRRDRLLRARADLAH